MANLVTLNDYKAYAGINSNTQDTQITSLLGPISQMVKTYCNRTFIDFYGVNKIEYFDGDVSCFYLNEAPIVSIVSVERSYDYGQTYTTLTNYVDYIVKIEEGCIKAVYNTNHYAADSMYTVDSPSPISSPKNPIFSYASNGYKITYKGGYVSCPEDLKVAVLDLIGYYLRADMSIKSTRLPGSNNSATVEYVTSTNFPAHIRRVIDMYRNAW